MAEPRPPDEENTRLAMALLDDDESALEEILRLYAPDVTALSTESSPCIEASSPGRTSRTW